MYSKTFPPAPCRIKEQLTDGKLSELTIEIDEPGYSLPIEKYQNNEMVNGVTAFEEYRGEPGKEKKVLVIALKPVALLEDIDKEFRSLISNLNKVTLKDKDFIISQYEKCLKKHDYDVSSVQSKKHGHDNHGSGSYAC